jgi:hypothetical protein
MPQIMETAKICEEEPSHRLPENAVESLPPIPVESQHRRHAFYETLKAFIKANRTSMCRGKNRATNLYFPHHEPPSESLHRWIMCLPF